MKDVAKFPVHGMSLRVSLPLSLSLCLSAAVIAHIQLAFNGPLLAKGVWLRTIWTQFRYSTARL